FEVIALKKGDEVVGARQGAETDELVFVTTRTMLAGASMVRVVTIDGIGTGPPRYRSGER
ncbi:hypothetical protein, partial [Clavibacter phaseoli]|uniref:hypothetical protein n=1 Tax=Clavibacter phaseoli TaxID=1734031 RepID=UPI000EC593EA